MASYLAERFDCPHEYGRELARICEYVAVTRGSGPLYDELHEFFANEAEPAPVHRLLAHLPGFLRESGRRSSSSSRRAATSLSSGHFIEAGEEFDVVAYVAAGPHRGKFAHLPPGGEARVIELPNTYTELDPATRPVILKIHGQVDRGLEREWESFVVSEDDHIDYLAHAGIAGLPAILAARLRRSHYLFLGYAPAEWPFRVFLHRVWGEERGRYRSWSVESRAEPFARELWRHLGVDLLDISIGDYLTQLDDRLEAVREAART